MSAFGNCEENKVDISQLKKFAMNARSELMAESDEKTAYFGFMRLCALHMAEPSFVAELMSKAEELRSCSAVSQQLRRNGQLG